MSKSEQLANERKLILDSYRKLLRSAGKFLSKSEKMQLRKAFDFSVEAHKDARRKSGEPYILHPLAVAQIVVDEIGLPDMTSLICALLHDVVEDTFSEVEDIEREFDPTIAKIIDGLTKISAVYDPNSSAQAENFRKMLLFSSDDIRVILIKLADRLHNMRTMEHMKRETQLKIASETSLLYAPLAHRLGLYSIKSELEDLCLKVTEPEVYQNICVKLEDSALERNDYLKKFINPLEEIMKDIGIRCQIKGRVKSIHSIYEKMKRQNIPFEEVFDLLAVRIIVSNRFKDRNEEVFHCFRAYTAVVNRFQANPNRTRDWLTTPKNNGYESIHTTVLGPDHKWVEVQIRTNRMDEEAEKGIAAHWKYKDVNGVHKKSKLDDFIDKISILLSNQNLSALDFLEEFKSHTYVEEVYVFTPKGDLKTFPQGATVLDFAYDVHTNLGNSCIGAKVNGKTVTMNHELTNGDQVFILSAKNRFPTQDWLYFVKSTKAKNAIKDALKAQRKEFIAKGKKLFDWKLEQLKIGEDHQLIKELLGYLKVPDLKEFQYRLGTHRVDVKSIQDFIEYHKNDINNPIDQVKIKPYEQLILEKRGLNPDDLIIGSDIDKLTYKLSTCCSPILGDEIIGISENEEIYIHKTNCKQAAKLMSQHGPRIVKAKWADHEDIEFLVSLNIIGQDRMGMLQNLVKVITLHSKKNIRAITIDTEGGMFDGVVKLYVSNLVETEKIISNLRKIPGVLSVRRLDY